MAMLAAAESASSSMSDSCVVAFGDTVTDRNLPTILHHLQWPEDPELHAPTLPP
jgi:hypothetical protein